MNKERRMRLNDASKYLSKASSIVESVCSAEQDAMDNIPENLQETDRYEAMEDAVDDMNEALDKIGEAMSYVRSAAARR